MNQQKKMLKQKIAEERQKAQIQSDMLKKRKARNADEEVIALAS